MHLRRLLIALSAVLLPGLCAAAESFGTIRPAACEQPVAPHCMLDGATFARKTDIAACTAQADLFAQALVGYRNCVVGDLQRVISDDNEVLSTYRCSAKGNAGCRR